MKLKINNETKLRVGTEKVKVGSCTKKTINDKEYAVVPSTGLRGVPEGVKLVVRIGETLLIRNGIQEFDAKVGDGKRGERVAVDHPTGVEIPLGADCVSVPANPDVTNPYGGRAWPLARQVQRVQARLYGVMDDGTSANYMILVDVVDE